MWKFVGKLAKLMSGGYVNLRHKDIAIKVKENLLHQALQRGRRHIPSYNNHKAVLDVKQFRLDNWSYLEYGKFKISTKYIRTPSYWLIKGFIEKWFKGWGFGKIIN